MLKLVCRGVATEGMVGGSLLLFFITNFVILSKLRGVTS
jgi:hypothetical protein